jgi:cell wall-associated NlpC family hydrolase
MSKKLGWLALACGVAAASCGSPAAFAAPASHTIPTARAGMTGALTAYNKNTSSVSAPSADSANASVSADIEKVIADGMRYRGTPYEFDSDRTTDKTFDCSDFVKWIYKETLGVELPYNSREQGDYIKQKGHVVTDWHKLRRGDLMFFMSYHGADASDYRGIDKSNARITHVALYLGNGKVLQTYSVNSGGVRVDSIEGTHFEYRFLFGGSVL